MENWCIDADGGEPKYSVRDLSPYHLIYHKSHIAWDRSYSPRWEVSYYFKYGKTSVCSYSDVEPMSVVFAIGPGIDIVGLCLLKTDADRTESLKNEPHSCLWFICVNNRIVT